MNLPEELEATFKFSFRPLADGCYGLNEWFDDFICWLGVPATKIMWSLDIWDQISWFFLQCRNQWFLTQPDSGYMGPPQPSLPNIWKTFDIEKDDLIRLNDLEYASDTSTGTQFRDAVTAKFNMLRDYWSLLMFPKDLDSAERHLV